MPRGADHSAFQGHVASDDLMYLCRPTHLSEDTEQLMKRYPAPYGSDFRISQVLLEPVVTANNYWARMHELLYVEEIAQYAIVSRSVLPVFLTQELLCYLLIDHCISDLCMWEFLSFGLNVE